MWNFGEAICISLHSMGMYQIMIFITSDRSQQLAMNEPVLSEPMSTNYT